jgi:hypothetical protein
MPAARAAPAAPPPVDPDRAPTLLPRPLPRPEHNQHLANLGTREAVRAFARGRRRWGLVAWNEPKPGEVSQDAVAAAPELGRYAISDGVTNSDLSGPFARALARRWTSADPTLQDFDRWLASTQKEWDQIVAPRIAAIEQEGAWYNQSRTWTAHATFLGVRLRAAEQGLVLQAVGVGDSILLHRRGGRLLTTWPLVASREFGDRVPALASRGAPVRKPQTLERSVLPGDEISLVTDALGAWILREHEAGRDPFAVLATVRSRQQAKRFVAAARRGADGRARLGVDDTSLVRFVVPGARP